MLAAQVAPEACHACHANCAQCTDCTNQRHKCGEKMCAELYRVPLHVWSLKLSKQLCDFLRRICCKRWPRHWHVASPGESTLPQNFDRNTGSSGRNTNAPASIDCRG